MRVQNLYFSHCIKTSPNYFSLSHNLLFKKAYANCTHPGCTMYLKYFNFLFKSFLTYPGTKHGLIYWGHSSRCAIYTYMHLLAVHVCLLSEYEELFILWLSLKDTVTLPFLTLRGVTCKGTNSHFSFFSLSAKRPSTAIPVRNRERAGPKDCLWKPYILKNSSDWYETPNFLFPLAHVHVHQLASLTSLTPQFPASGYQHLKDHPQSAPQL